MTSPADEPAPRVRCPDCHKRRPCGCDSEEWRQEQEGNRFAKRHGAHIPGTTTARVLGGALERTDRGDPADAVRRLEAGRAEYANLRAHLDLVRMRLALLRKMRGEAVRLERYERVLTIMVERGGRLQDVARSLGYKSHSVGSELFAAIRAEAHDRSGDATGPVVATPCACGRAGCVVVQRMGRGRPGRWNLKCRWAAENARRNRRRKGRGNLPVQISPSVEAKGKEGTAA